MSPPERRESPSDTETHTSVPSSGSTPSKIGLNSTVKAALYTLLGAGAAGGIGLNAMQMHLESQERQALEKRVDDYAYRYHDVLARLRALQGKVDAGITLDRMMEVVEKVTPSTVRVSGPLGLGSGVLITDKDGEGLYVLTNAHVTEENSFQNPGGDAFYTVTFYAGDDYKEPVMFQAAPEYLKTGERAISPSNVHDLALLRVPHEVLKKIRSGKIHAHPIEFRDMADTPIRVGEPVLAIGNPFGERDHVTSGIVSHAQAYGDIEPENVFLRTDAPINPGNSGGALVDMQGRLIGINTWGYRGGDGVSGSIRIDEVKNALEQWGLPVMSPAERKLYDDFHRKGTSEKDPTSPFQGSSNRAA